MQVRINFVDLYRYTGVESPHEAMANNFMKCSTAIHECMILYDMQRDTTIVTRLEKCEWNLKRYIEDIRYLLQT